MTIFLIILSSILGFCAGSIRRLYMLRRSMSVTRELLMEAKVGTEGFDHDMTVIEARNKFAQEQLESFM